MIRRDMREVLGVEQEAFEFPWSDEDFTRCLRQRNCIGMVAESGDSVVAFMIYELHRSRLHVLNFAVARSHRRLGVATRMMEKLIGKLTPERRNRIVLEVRRPIFRPNSSSARWDSARSRCSRISIKTRPRMPT